MRTAAPSFTTARKRNNVPSTPLAANSTASSLSRSTESATYPQIPQTRQKFEWNCKGEERDIWKYVIQFRASGVRVKRPTTAPSLIAMTTTQVPIIAWEKRYMTVRECARLQSMESLEHFPKVPTRAFKALGNGINAKLMEFIAKALIES